MVKITNNMTDFIENHTGEIIIYGAGNAGYWIGHYMNKCNVDFSMYIDRAIIHEGALFNNKPVYKPEKLAEFTGKSIRIIVSPVCYAAIMYDLTKLTEKYSISVLCLVPVYKSIIANGDSYNINKLLAYFRNKLFVGDVPTIISYDCAGGLIYDMMNWVMVSPTVNTIFTYEDYIKICQNPRKYLLEDIEDISWGVFYNIGGSKREMLHGKLGDIDIWFAHTDRSEGLAERWHILGQHIKWDNLVYLLMARIPNIPISVLRSFSELKQKHLTVFREGFSYVPEGFSDYVNANTNISLFALRDSAIENYFDLLGWLNQDCL